jgi:cation diffusion facilitator family transporter
MKKNNYNISFEAAKNGMRTTIIGICVSIVFAIIKIVTGIMGNSYALIADGIESTTDVFASIIVVTGLRIAQLPPDEKHPYGHGKAEPFAGLIVSFALLISALIIIVQSVKEIITPHFAPAPFTLIVLLLVIIVKEVLFRSILKVGDKYGSIALTNDAWHHRSDAITSAAVFIGISIALIGGKGYEAADDFAALFASVIIIYNAFRLMKPALDEIMDATPTQLLKDEIIKVAKTVNGVIASEKCLIRKMGFDYFIDIHIIVDGNLSVFDGHEISHKVKNRLTEKFSQINNVLVHIEPATEERLNREHIKKQIVNESY